MILVVVKWLKKVDTVAFTFFPFIFIADRNKFLSDPTNLNHEKIHGRQQVEMLLIFFYLWYYTEFLIRALRTGWNDIAYYRISFEREAYRNEKNMEYLSSRSDYSWMNYL
jgi:hypothetical protein